MYFHVHLSFWFLLWALILSSSLNIYFSVCCIHWMPRKSHDNRTGALASLCVFKR